MTRNSRTAPLPAPFLRWAGGKSRIAHLLAQLAPLDSDYARYIEPFLGSGALFFRLHPKHAILADLNPLLINCFTQVAEHPQAVSRLLQKHLALHSKEYYYRLRRLGLNHGDRLQRAARFIYINKTAFNGIFRVNRSGKFNVPYGPSQSGPAIPDQEALLAAASRLKTARLHVGPFETTCAMAKARDFVYLDPPYPPLASSANFTHYTADRFTADDQERVAAAFKALDRKGSFVMLSNSDQPEIRALYRGYNLISLKVTRWLGSNGKRFRVQEIVATNYRPPQIRQ